MRVQRLLCSLITGCCVLLTWRWHPCRYSAELGDVVVGRVTDVRPRPQGSFCLGGRQTLRDLQDLLRVPCLPAKRKAPAVHASRLMSKLYAVLAVHVRCAGRMTAQGPWAGGRQAVDRGPERAAGGDAAAVLGEPAGRRAGTPCQGSILEAGHPLAWLWHSACSLCLFCIRKLASPTLQSVDAIEACGGLGMTAAAPHRGGRAQHAQRV